MAFDGPPGSDYQQIPQTGGQQPPHRTLVEHSGFMDGLKSLKDKASGLVHQGSVKGQEILHGETATKVKTQVVKTSQDVMRSPVTHQITNEAVQTGKQLARENVNNVNGVVRDAKAGNVRGVIAHAAPLAGEVALGPGGVVAGVVKAKVVEHVVGAVPAGQQGALRHVADYTHAVPSLSITGMAKEELLRQTSTATGVNTHRTTAHPALDAAERAQSSSSTADAMQSASTYLKGLAGKVHLASDKTPPPPVKHE